MINLIIYSAVTILVVILAITRQYFILNPRKNQNEEVPSNHMNKIPTLTLVIISFILSLYSAYLATSGYLTDTDRYAWSFLYRYPVYYESLETMFNSGTEIGFLLLSMLVNSFTNDPYWLFFVIAFITTFLNLFTAAKISKSFVLFIFLYLVSLYFFYSTFLLRQVLSVSFANLAFLAYLKGRNLNYFSYCIVALTFHATSIILFCMYFIFNKVKTLRQYLFLVIISLIVFFSFGSIFNTILPSIPYIDQFINIEDMELSTGGGSVTSILKGIPFYFISIVAIVRRHKIKHILDKADFYIVCSVLYSVSWLLTYNMYWFFRMGLYFLLPTLILVPSLFSTIKNSKERILYYIIFIFTLIVITFRQIFITLQ